LISKSIKQTQLVL